mgnify:CR=1 FL=1|tara:strand:+ start:1927 stop:2217 length:291 start_codon:yes stop_codon:yes gene_type:complete
MQYNLRIYNNNGDNKKILIAAQSQDMTDLINSNIFDFLSDGVNFGTSYEFTYNYKDEIMTFESVDREGLYLVVCMPVREGDKDFLGAVMDTIQGIK